MATEREARELAEFFKFKEIGQIVVGVADKFGSSGKFDTQYLVFEPALLRLSKEANPMKYGSLAIGLSADLLAKINPKHDIGRYLSVELTGYEPSPKGSPKKIFKVLELTVDEFARLERRATGDYAHAFRVEQAASGEEDDDDLPF